MHESYLEVISLVERLHRRILELIKVELDRLGSYDINNVQAMMLFNLGDEEMTVGELTLRGCYMGTNVTYNVKKLVESGYLEYQRSHHDRRSVFVRLTTKGQEIHNRLNEIHQRNVELLHQSRISETDLRTAMDTLRRFERLWMQSTDLAPRQRSFIAA